MKYSAPSLFMLLAFFLTEYGTEIHLCAPHMQLVYLYLESSNKITELNFLSLDPQVISLLLCHRFVGLFHFVC